jgi:hypothetical protein
MLHSTAGAMELEKLAKLRLHLSGTNSIAPGLGKS